MARVSIPVSDRDFKRYSIIFPWGTRAAVFRRVMQLVCDQIEKDGYNVIELLISGRYNPLDGIKERGKLT